MQHQTPTPIPNPLPIQIPNPTPMPMLNPVPIPNRAQGLNLMPNLVKPDADSESEFRAYVGRLPTAEAIPKQARLLLRSLRRTAGRGRPPTAAKEMLCIEWFDHPTEKRPGHKLPSCFFACAPRPAVLLVRRVIARRLRTECAGRIRDIQTSGARAGGAPPELHFGYQLPSSRDRAPSVRPARLRRARVS